MNFKRAALFIVIILICVLSIIIGAYSVINISTTSGKKEDEQYVNDKLKTQEELEEDFVKEFDNTIDLNGFDTMGIKKENPSKEIVYTGFVVNRKTDNYEISANIPVVNVSGKLYTEINNQTQSIFINKLNEIVKNEEQGCIYSMVYKSYVNDGVLYLLIKSTLKEEGQPQRVIFKSFHYDIKTGEEIGLKEILEKRNVTEEDFNKKVKSQMEQAIKESNSVQFTGYSLFNRNINSDIYELENSDDFFVDNDNNLYIIYAYGNNEYTSELDIIVF